jgi:hypothetical protein
MSLMVPPNKIWQRNRTLPLITSVTRRAPNYCVKRNVEGASVATSQRFSLLLHASFCQAIEDDFLLFEVAPVIFIHQNEI